MRFTGPALAILTVTFAPAYSVSARDAAPGNLRRRAQRGQPVSATRRGLQSLSSVATTVLPSVDRKAAMVEDAFTAATAPDAPPRFAIPNHVAVSAKTGDWEKSEDGALVWRHRVQSHGCNSLNFGFTEYWMPEGGKLFVVDGGHGGNLMGRSFDNTHNKQGQLWTPIANSCDCVIEVNLPAGTNPSRLRLTLGNVGVGYKGFGTRPHAPPKGTSDGRRRELSPAFDVSDLTPESGSCNVDVVCSASDDDKYAEIDNWRDEIPSVAIISLEGSTMCTGSMLNNVKEDRVPYFLTARHCGIRSFNAQSLVTYWSYETSVCQGTPDGNLNQHTLSGSVHLLDNLDSDMTLVKLTEGVPDDWITDKIVSFAGWDNSGADADSATAIHHPSTDEKRISFEDQPTTTSRYGGAGSGTTHVRVADWDLGTTEPGSSGSPLFDQDHRVIGQLHGGSAACGNNQPDWYGKFSVSWEDADLAQYLDPESSGATTVDTLTAPTGPTPPPAPTPPPTPTPAPTPCAGGLDVAVKIVTDAYPGETQWSLSPKTTVCDNDEPRQDFGGYEDADQEYIETFCFTQPGQFEFTITDEYGDGICCSYGQGSYEITVNGVVKHEGGDFGYSESETIGTCDAPPTPPPVQPPSEPPVQPPTPPPVAPTKVPTSGAPTFLTCSQHKAAACEEEDDCVWTGTCHNCGCVPKSQ